MASRMRVYLGRCAAARKLGLFTLLVEEKGQVGSAHLSWRETRSELAFHDPRLRSA